jgi:tetratricopeptide (TPR) repeat protein
MTNCDTSTAMNFCETAISLALSTSNIRKHSQGLYNLAWIKWTTGDFSESLAHASEAGRLARISADLHAEARELQIMSMCSSILGNYKQCISLCSRARDLLALCGMSGGELDHSIMTTQAEMYRLKSEYVEAHSIHSQILQETSVDQNFYAYGFTLLNVAEIAVSIGAPKEDVQRNCETARGIFNTAGYVEGGTRCDRIVANLYLREGNLLAAKTLFERCLKLSSIHHEIYSYCLEQLANASHWSAHVPSSTTVFLAHSVRRKEKAGIHKAFQLLGDVFLAQDDEHTAVNLFTAALEGFTYMDVHQSRAECLLRLGDISKGHNNLLQAVEFWETARPLFERSTQAKQVENIDQRLADVGEDVLEQHRKNLARLAESSVPVVTVDINSLEDMEGLNLDEQNKEVDLMAV